MSAGIDDAYSLYGQIQPFGTLKCWQCYIRNTKAPSVWQ